MRYYENVLLYVNRNAGRAGVKGTYQDPGLFGGGANNVQLEAGRRVWLVSPGYAKALEAEVPDGSFSNGTYAKVKRFAQHIVDLIKSVDDAPNYLAEVAGEYAQAIADHMPQIIGVVVAFLAAEAASSLLAASPTGVGQIAAVLIQLVLGLLGVAGMVQAGIDAVKHAAEWLTLAWTASGDPKQVKAASKEFLKMLVSIALAALAWMGVKGNLGTAAKIFNSIDSTPTLAFAVAGGGTQAGAGAGAAVAGGIPGPFGPLGTAMAMSGAGRGRDSDYWEEKFEGKPKREPVSDSYAKQELQESGWLKKRLPDIERRRQFMDWLEKNHKLGEEHQHLKPGSKYAKVHAEEVPGRKSLGLNALPRWNSRFTLDPFVQPSPPPVFTSDS